MLELLIAVVRALTLTLRGHRELVLENLACANSWRPCTAQRSTPGSGRSTASFGSSSREAGETGARHCWSCNRTPSFGGIASGFAADGGAARSEQMAVLRLICSS